MPWSELRRAIEMGELAKVGVLLASGEDINGERGASYSLLHHAVEGAIDGSHQTGEPPDLRMVELLVGNGADRSSIDSDGETPLEVATNIETEQRFPAEAAALERLLSPDPV